MNSYSSSMSSSVVDMVVTNAVIFTGDESLPFADSMAILHRRVFRVGSFSFIQDLIGSRTKVLNLGGKVVVPGFIDSHGHVIFQGQQMMQADFRGVNDKDDFVRRIEEAVRSTKKGAWVLGGGWNNDLWGDEMPNASWIDNATLFNPVLLSRIDGHMSLANSVALNLAGIANLTKDPDGGTIVRTSSGEPTGLLIDSARNLVQSFIPEVSVDERREALLKASKLALTRGVTTIVDFGRYYPGGSIDSSWEDFRDVYQWANSLEKMTVRDLMNNMGPVVSQWIYLGGVKAFFDGSLGSHSALFHEPYIDEPNNCGLQVMEFESLLSMAKASDKSGLQVAMHAIGDRANDMVLDIYESISSANGTRDRRFRVEHSQHLAPAAIARFGQQEIIASMQPEHLLDDADSATKKLGPDRAQKESFLFRSLLANNARLIFGSDCPVADINPLGGIQTAIKRIPRGWDDAWIPSECLTLPEALKAYTSAAAHACFLEGEIGSLSPGKLADFVILTSDSWDEFEVGGCASVEATYVGDQTKTARSNRQTVLPPPALSCADHHGDLTAVRGQQRNLNF